MTGGRSMEGTLAPPPTVVGEALANGARIGPDDIASKDLACALLKARRSFGISRVGAVTRLDRVGIPVVQVVRPLALSNAVSQGKGADIHQATISGIMEGVETWAAESIPRSRVFHASAAELGDDVQALYRAALTAGAPPAWERETIAWTTGWDIVSGRERPVPMALVDTCYVLPSPHPVMFPRTTTGLGAGATLTRALAHAALELLEKDAVTSARRRPYFFDRWGIDAGSVKGGASLPVLQRILEAGLLCGIWQVPTSHTLPVYWCRIMEADEDRELAPLPADGFGCDFTHDRALAKALLEACQARVGAVAGAREDIPRRLYSAASERDDLAEWRALLATGQGKRPMPRDSGGPGSGTWSRIQAALLAEGAQGIVVVPLYRSTDPPVEVLRVVAPGLRHGERI
jgi:ribosomal protein S12 methylthiotransferase accessory factor